LKRKVEFSFLRKKEGTTKKFVANIDWSGGGGGETPRENKRGAKQRKDIVKNGGKKGETSKGEESQVKKK